MGTSYYYIFIIIITLNSQTVKCDEKYGRHVMKNTKRLISFILCLIMLASFIPQITFAEVTGTGTVTNPYVVTTYDELRTYMAQAPTDGRVRQIKLGCDITSVDMQNDYALTLTQAGQDVVLDLAGHKITRESSVTVDYGVFRAKEGKLTINDSVGTGGVYAKGNFISVICLSATDPIYTDNGTIIINGGTYENDCLAGDTLYNEASRLYVNGGTFKAYRNALAALAGVTHVNGGTFYALGTSPALYLSVSGEVVLYNLKAYGNMKLNDAREDIWACLHETGEAYINGTRQTRSKTWKFEGNRIEIKTDVVDTIWITAQTPEVNKAPATSVDVPYGSGYGIYEEYGAQVVVWMKDGNFMPTETFRPSTAYTLRVYVQVNEPVTFDLSAYVNGKEATLEYKTESDGSKFYWVEYTFPPTINVVMESASAVIPTPVAGEKAIAGPVDSTDKYNVSVTWQTTANAEDLGNFNNQTFVAGTTYYALVSVVSEDPYIFMPGAKIIVNGTPYVSSWTLGADYPKYIYAYVPFTAQADAQTCTHSYGEYIYNNDANELKDGTKTRYCTLCNNPETVTAVGTKWQNPFTDVPNDSFYYVPVLWAVANNITNGTTATTFSPNVACSRAQIVTFLWRAAGKPAPKGNSNPFTDVKSGQYYSDAVLWAVEQGITNGTSATTFSPDAVCTRAQIVTFLWRAAGKPAPKGNNNPFIDVIAGQYYTDAVLWAVEKGITNGTSPKTFAPNTTCTRSQIVTFIYRYYK